MVDFIQILVPNQTDHRCKSTFPTVEVNILTTSFWNSKKPQTPNNNNNKTQHRNPQKFSLQNGIVINGYP